MTMSEPENERTYLSVAEWSSMRDELKNLRRGTSKLVPVLEQRNPKITPTQGDTLVDDLDEIIRNMIDFRQSIKQLTKNP